jgi:hypothetical protein
VVFSCVVVAKSLMWHSAATTLVRTMAATRTSCVEPASDEFTWLRRAPNGIIDNWALPSLALVIQDVGPRKLLLQSGDCGRFFESGMVQVDPWTLIPASVLIPPFG